MNDLFLVCDPGATGAIGVFSKEQNKLLEFICNYDIKKYKEFIEKYNGLKLLLEFIPNVMGGAYASFVLGKNIGAIKGLSYGLVEVIEKGNMPQQWKSPWSKEIDELKKRTKINSKGKKVHLDNKEIDIILCEKYYPELDLNQPELDKDGNQIIIKKGLNKGNIKYKKHDGLADMNLMGHSAIIRNLL